MAIKQFNATYLVNDDRVLFRFNTDEDTEFRFWFTRRVTLFVLSVSQHLIVQNLEQSHTPEASKAIAEFAKGAVQVFSGDGLGQEHYQQANHFPFGADLLLVLDVKCALEKQGSEDIFSLDLVLPGGSNLNLKLSQPLLQAMCILLNQMRERAGWGEVPQVQRVDAADVAGSATGKKGDNPLMH